MKTYRIRLNNYGDIQYITADCYKIQDNIVMFEVYDEYFQTVAVYNINNIIGFELLKGGD